MPRRKNVQSNGAPAAKEGKWKKKAPKDKNAPKRPLTAFIAYSMERRPELESKHPNIKMSNIMKITSQEWKELSDETKKIYLDKASKEMEAYNKAMGEYRKTDLYREYKTKVDASEKSGKRKHGDSKKATRLSESDVNGSTMVAGTSQIRIFSDEFLLYNKEQETELRNLRRKLNVSIEEENSLKKLIAAGESRHEALRAEMRTEHEALDNGQQTLQRWERILKRVLQNVPMPALWKEFLDKDFDSFLTTLAENQSGRTHEFQQAAAAIRGAIANISFD
uniref:HMG box domain-containing protein n=1 Tax=Steinernema glaseri TaxID=37863 RepID=A0A1I7YYU6_9BILA